MLELYAVVYLFSRDYYYNCVCLLQWKATRRSVRMDGLFK